MKLKDATTDYLAYLRHEQGATLATFRTYQNGLRIFLRWLEANGHPDPTTFHFTTANVRAYHYANCNEGFRPRTLRGRMQPVKALAAFLLQNGAIKTNPVAGVTLPKKDPAVRLTVSEDEVRSLLDAVERLPDANRLPLYRGVLCVLIFAGLRRQECLDLHASDFDTEDGGLLVRCGKGRKQRTVFLPPVAQEALSAWIAVRPASDLSYLFLWDRSKRVSQSALARIVEEVKSIAGLRGAPNIKPHSLRHFYASHLLHNGADLESIRQLLGHADLRTTHVYIHSDRQRVKDVAQLAALTPKPTEQADDDKIIRLPMRQEQERSRLRRIAR